MRVAIFGGSFNPVHVAHQLVALYVRETQPVDELWFVPTYEHPFGKPLAPYEDRVAMCELAAADIAGAKVSRAEEELAHRPGFVTSHTIDLVDYLAGQGHALRFVIGTDILAETHKWHRWDDIIARAPPIIIGRSGHASAGAIDGPGLAGAGSAAVARRGVIDGPGLAGVGSAAVARRGVIDMPTISSTAIRAMLAAGDAGVSALLPASVLRYIAAHKLYS